MSTFQSAAIALAVLATCGPLAMYFADRSGLPDYGCNPNQKPGWTILYVLTIFPTAAAVGWLLLLVAVWIMRW